MFEAIFEGLAHAGWVMVPLLAASLVGWYLAARRWLALSALDWKGYSKWRAGLDRSNWEKSMPDLGKRARATAAGRALLAVYESRRSDREEMENRLDEVMKFTLPELDRHLSTLAILAAAAPLIGLLGTVDGIIGTFKVISIFGTGNAALMSASISEALLATQNGLLCAFPLMLMQVYLTNKAERIERDALAAGATLINRISGRDPSGGRPAPAFRVPTPASPSFGWSP